MLMKMIKKCKL
jgi:hypothetical protein